MAERMKQTERELANIKKEANNYQNMLQQSQAQYVTLEKKYGRVKKILREFQHRERDMVSDTSIYHRTQTDVALAKLPSITLNAFLRIRRCSLAIYRPCCTESYLDFKGNCSNCYILC